MSDFHLAHERPSGKLYVREWRPGDGLRCNTGKKAGRIPCGPPFAVVQSVSTYTWTTRVDRHTRIVCALHLPGVASAGEISAEAVKAATERLAVEHWDEYQGYIEAETARRVNEVIEFATAELRRITLGEEADQ